RARYYDSRTGRFLSRDPQRSLDPRRITPYLYALSNPLRYIDKTGAAPEPVATSSSSVEEALRDYRRARQAYEAAREAEEYVAETLKEAASRRTAEQKRKDSTVVLDDPVSIYVSLLAGQRAVVEAFGSNLFQIDLTRSERKSTDELRREAEILKLKVALEKARAELNDNRSRTRAEQRRLEENVRKAQKAFEEAGGIESIIPELSPIVILD
ncbi:MAG: hypothetical protein D6815_09970, partial [Candidatus Dadabacteria bacterium]